MAVTANSIITPQTPKSAQAVCTAQKVTTTLNDNSNTVLLLTAGPNGCRLTKLVATPRATVSATGCLVFTSPDGTAMYLKDSASMAAQTIPTPITAAVTRNDFAYSDANPMILGPNERVYVAISVALAAGVVFAAEYADY